MFLPWAITAFGGPEGYFSLAIIAFGAFQFIAPKYYFRLGKMDKRQTPLFKEVRPSRWPDWHLSFRHARSRPSCVNGPLTSQTLTLQWIALHGIDASSTLGFEHPPSVEISLGWHRIQKPLKPGNTKKIRKIYKIPHSGLEPQHTAKNTKKKNENSQKMAIFVIFQPRMGDFVIFSLFFVHFPVLGKIDKMLPKPRSQPVFGHSAGPTKSDRPYC